MKAQKITIAQAAGHPFGFDVFCNTCGAHARWRTDRLAAFPRRASLSDIEARLACPAGHKGGRIHLASPNVMGGWQ